MTDDLPAPALALLRSLKDGALSYDKCAGEALDALMIEGLAAWGDAPLPGRGFGWRLVKITEAGRLRLEPEPQGAEQVVALIEQRIREGKS